MIDLILEKWKTGDEMEDILESLKLKEIPLHLRMEIDDPKSFVFDREGECLIDKIFPDPPEKTIFKTEEERTIEKDIFHGVRDEQGNLIN